MTLPRYDPKIIEEVMAANRPRLSRWIEFFQAVNPLSANQLGVANGK